MLDSEEELLSRIRLGEDNELELKAVAFAGARVSGPRRDGLADELAAMANTADGVCLLGVDDVSRDVVGVPLDSLDLVESFVRELCHDSITPPLPVRIIRMQLPDSLGELRAILKVDVPRSLFVHRSPGGYLMRVGSSKRQMPPDYLARLFQQRSQARLIRFDEQAVPDSGLGSLTPELWKRFVDPAAEDPVRTLHKRKLLTVEDGVERATVAGALLCSSDPSSMLPGASARAVRFRGVEQDSTRQIDAADIAGPIDQQILGLYGFALRSMSRFVREDGGRHEVPQFSERALFEGIVNALVHRDYSIHGSRVRLFLFDDRAELYSPGALPNSLSVDSIALRQSTRNEAIKSIMIKLPVGPAGAGSGRGYFMEAQGDGVPVILRETLALSGQAATWRVLDESEVVLTLPAADPERG